MTTDSAQREEDDPGRESGGGEPASNPAPVQRAPDNKSSYSPWTPPEPAAPARRNFALSPMRGLQSLLEGDKPEWLPKAIVWITGALAFEVVAAITSAVLLGRISAQVFIIMLGGVFSATLFGGVFVTWLWLRRQPLRPKPRARKAMQRKAIPRQKAGEDGGKS